MPFIWGFFRMASDSWSASQECLTKLRPKICSRFFFFPLNLSTPLFLPLITSSLSLPPLPLPTEWSKLWLDVAKNLVHLRKINPIVSGRFLQLAHIFTNFTLKSVFSLDNDQHYYHIYTCSTVEIMAVTGWKFCFENRKVNCGIKTVTVHWIQLW